jgi:hypothetical protein
VNPTPIDNFRAEFQRCYKQYDVLTGAVAMLRLSFGDDRIQGDMTPYYGVEARHAAIPKVITNQVAGIS